MGFIVYNADTKMAEKYYKLERSAKAHVTRLTNQPWYRNKTFKYCSYAEYEGFLQGMNESHHLLWKFMHQGILQRN